MESGRAQTRRCGACGLWAAVAIGLVAYLGLVRLDTTAGTLRDGFTRQTIGWYLLAFAGFLLALWWAERNRIPLLWLWAAPVVFRLLLLATTPTLSDDVYRYLWDGHVAASGVNPYAHALDAPELDHLHIPARDLANNPSLGTPYLPAAQAVFAASAVAAPSSPLTLQVAMTAFDLAAAGIIVALLRKAELPRRRVMLYLWNPLVIVEVAHGAHLDALMVFLALLAVYLTLVRPSLAAPGALALAVLTKPLPLLLVPVLWPRWRGSQRWLFGATVAVVLVPFGWTGGWGVGERTGTGVFGSIREFSDWVFNGGVYHWLRGWLGNAPGLDATLAARLVVAAVMAAVVVVVWRRARERPEPRAALGLLAAPVMAYAVLTPVLHPWYLLLLVALLPFVGSGDGLRRWLPVAPWLYLCAALVVSYLTYLDPLAHGEIEWVRRVEWLPTLGLLGVAAAAGLREPRERQRVQSGADGQGPARPSAVPE